MPSSDQDSAVALRRLAAAPAELTLARLWSAMPADDRTSALRIRLGKPNPAGWRTALEQIVADERRFRPQTLARWTDERLAEAAGRLRSLHFTNERLNDLIVDLHLAQRRPLMGAFLSAAGIAHDDGAFLEGPPDVEVSAEQLSLAADRVDAEFPESEMLTYLLAIRRMWPRAFAQLDAWFAQHVAVPTREVLPAPKASEPRSDAQEAAQYVDVETFTSLDRRLILTIVDAAAGIEGAATSDELDDLLLELQELNGRRHRTFFHTGFRDALFEYEPAERLAADNDGRRRWYWAGYVTGLARHQTWNRIAELFDSVPTIRALGSIGDGASDAASALVFNALVREHRYGEATAFAQREAVAASRKLQVALLEVGTDLVRRQRAIEARPVLDTLFLVLTGLEDPSPEIEVVRTEAQRRLALCLRQLGEMERAKHLLEPLTQHPSEEIRGTSLSDLGLLKSRFRRLGELTLPTDKHDLQQVQDRLECGVHEFEQAISLPTFQAPHAHFALGVRAFFREDYGTAKTHFDYALSWFSGRPTVYQLDGTLDLTRLYLGLAIVLSLDGTSALERACDLIQAALEGSARLAPWLVRPTVEALGIARGDLVSATATLILEKCGSGVLDELTGSDEGQAIHAVRLALAQRALDPARPLVKRAEDAYRVLPWLLQHGEHDLAAAVLETAEDLAHQNIMRAEFDGLLEDPVRFSPAWDDARAVAARVRLLEAAGEYASAADQLEAYCHRVLATSDPHALDMAELALADIDSYGSQGREAAYRIRDVVDARMARESAPASAAGRSGAGGTYAIRILVVGGNEQQHRMEDDVRAQVAERFPGVSLDFLQTGWSGNWSSYVDEFERRVAQADGVVFLSLMRTMFGRTVRARCHVPWRGCSGRGQGVIVNTVERLLPAARSYLERQHQALRSQSSGAA